MKETTSERLQTLAMLFGENQTQMRERLGFSKSTMNNYWHGKRLPKQNVLTHIAETYRVNETWLMGYDVPMQSGLFNPPSEIFEEEDAILLELYHKLSRDDKDIIMSMLKRMSEI